MSNWSQREHIGKARFRTVLACVAAVALSMAALVSAAPSAGAAPAAALPAVPTFGPNVLVFNPTMPQSEIQAEVDAVAAQQLGNQFGTQRYALLFEPGTYGSAETPLNFQVGYYTEVAGLGRDPGDTVIN